MENGDNESTNRYGKKAFENEIDPIVAKARREQAEREKTYRERSLKIHPWICARCGREFTSRNIHLLTVHHKDHNHENNPPDGSNWENLCVYCHDNEHSRYLDYMEGGGTETGTAKQDKLKHNPFSKLQHMMKKEKKKKS